MRSWRCRNSNGDVEFRRYGLAVDTIEEYTLVTPTGEVHNVSDNSDPVLFAALKGTGNNFGIITNFKLRTVEQAKEIFGGRIYYSAESYSQVLPLIERFSSSANTENKAALVASFTSYKGQQVLLLELYYNGANPPSPLFADFLAIPSMSSDVSTRSYVSWVKSASGDLAGHMQALPNTAPVRKYSISLLKQITELVAVSVEIYLAHFNVKSIADVGDDQNAGAAGSAHSGFLISVSVEVAL